ncbi:MAG: hypothetical protein Q4F05_18580 [bacterium]|nr:hypothetical protein [bacterium]
MDESLSKNRYGKQFYWQILMEKSKTWLQDGLVSNVEFGIKQKQKGKVTNASCGK